jgi:hypothetical protein
MRGLVARLRSSRAVAFYRRLDGTSEQDGMPWITTFADDGDAAALEARGEIVVCEPGKPGETSDAAPTTERLVNEPPVDEAAVNEPPVDEAAVDEAALDEAAVNEPAVHEPAVDSQLVPALNRVADAFERMAASIEVEHVQREARLEAVERLLHELVTGLAQPTAVPPVVVGGSIDLEARRVEVAGAGPTAEIERSEIDLSGPRLELDDSDDVPLDSA